MCVQHTYTHTITTFCTVSFYQNSFVRYASPNILVDDTQKFKLSAKWISRSNSHIYHSLVTMPLTGVNFQSNYIAIPNHSQSQFSSLILMKSSGNEWISHHHHKSVPFFHFLFLFFLTCWDCIKHNWNLKI